jgi:hypothetical protein
LLLPEIWSSRDNHIGAFAWLGVDREKKDGKERKQKDVWGNT